MVGKRTGWCVGTRLDIRTERHEQVEADTNRVFRYIPTCAIYSRKKAAERKTFIQWAEIIYELVLRNRWNRIVGCIHMSEKISRVSSRIGFFYKFSGP